MATAGAGLSFEADPYVAARGAHAIALLTDWGEYLHLDWERIYASMERPAFLFDGRNHLDAEKLYRIGFNVYSSAVPISAVSELLKPPRDTATVLGTPTPAPAPPPGTDRAPQACLPRHRRLPRRRLGPVPRDVRARDRQLSPGATVGIRVSARRRSSWNAGAAAVI